MSGFKKLRLDPELSKSLSNQPGACSSDSFGRGYGDSSSFSSSTSGGNGGGSAIRRSSGPFRTKYTQPVGGSASFSRFSPYYFGKERRQSLKVPLIRARRDDSDSERPSSRASFNSSIGGDSTTSVTSSTAQRIIETLQNLSTPVINAGKIRIDQDIKAVQPFFGSTHFRTSPGASLNRSTGPPKMCSSLLLSNPSPANQISPMTDQRRLFCIPKMVDAATNTDKEADNYQSSQQPSKCGSLPPPKSPIAYSSSTGTSVKSIKFPPSKADKDSDDEEFHECCSDFEFSSAWSPDRFSRYFTSEKDKSGNGRGSLTAGTPHQPFLINGYKEDAPLQTKSGYSALSGSGATTNFKPSNPSSQNLPGALKPAGSGGFGALQGSDSSADDLSKKQRIISTLNDHKLTSTTAFGFSPRTPSNNAGLTPGGSTKSGFESERRQKRKYSYEDEDENDTPAKPSRTSFGATTGADKTRTSIDTIGTATSQQQQVTSSPLPNIEKNDPPKQGTSSLPSLSTFASTQSKNKWSCPTCMTFNELDVPACVCCSEKNPNASAPIPAPATTTKWTCPTCMVKNEPTDLLCVCCSEKNPNPVNSTGSEKKDSAVVPQSTFKFGLSEPSAGSSSTSSSTPSTFSFGVKSSAEPQNTSASFSFGAPATTSAVTAPSFQGSTNFKFGATTTAPASKSTTIPVTLSGSQNTTATFKFGASTPTPSSTTSSSQASTPTAGSFKFGGTTTCTSTPSTTSLASKPVTTPVTQSVLSGSQNSPASFNFGTPKSSSHETSGTTLPTISAASETVPAVTQSSLSGPTGFKFGMSSPLNSSSTPSFSFGGNTNPAISSSNSTTITSTASPFGKPTMPDASNEATKTTPVFGSSSFSSGSSGNFSFGNAANPNPTSDSQKPSSFGFGAASPPKQQFSSFAFGSSGQHTPASTSIIASPTTMPSAAPTPALNAPPSFNFGSGSGPMTTPFGQMQQPTSNPAPPTPLFQFGSSAPTTSIPAPNPAASFSLTPNLNFGAATPGSTIPQFGNPTPPTLNAGAQAPPPLFQFSASSPSATDRSGRPIKRAVRRTMRK